MNEMFERIVRAISIEVPTCAGVVCVFTPLTECTCGKIVKGALAAMREPTADMIEVIPAGAHPGMHETVRENWRAMIDAALK
jgi:hypothetical protein